MLNEHKGTRRLTQLIPERTLVLLLAFALLVHSLLGGFRMYEETLVRRASSECLVAGKDPVLLKTLYPSPEELAVKADQLRRYKLSVFRFQAGDQSQ